MMHYCTYAEAEAVTTEGATIELMSGFSYPDCITVTKNLTILASGGPVTLSCLILDGAGKTLIMGSSLTVTNLTLTAGKIRTNSYNLKCGSITGGTSSSYVITD